MSELPKAPVIRIAKEQGAERISEDAGVALTEAVVKYAEELSRRTIELANHADRKTLQQEDVELATKHYWY